MRSHANTLATLALLSPLSLTGACTAEGAPPLDGELDLATAQPLVRGNSLKHTALYVSDTQATMYQWAARTAPVIRVLPEHAVVRVGNAVPKKGFYQVIHAGTWGWIYGSALTERHGPHQDLSARRTEAIRLAQTAMGFSYWCSNARWDVRGPTIMPVENTGLCDGNCPKCTHEATGDVEYGADCSGFVSTIWGVGGRDADTDPDTNPTNNGFATKAFAKDNSRWDTIELEDALPGDAVVRHDNMRKHIFLVGAAPDATGAFSSYECVGCEAGCRTQRKRVADLDDWTAIRASGWPDN